MPEISNNLPNNDSSSNNNNDNNNTDNNINKSEERIKKKTVYSSEKSTSSKLVTNRSSLLQSSFRKRQQQQYNTKTSNGKSNKEKKETEEEGSIIIEKQDHLEVAVASLPPRHPIKIQEAASLSASSRENKLNDAGTILTTTRSTIKPKEDHTIKISTSAPIANLTTPLKRTTLNNNKPPPHISASSDSDGFQTPNIKESSSFKSSNSPSSSRPISPTSQKIQYLLQSIPKKARSDGNVTTTANKKNQRRSMSTPKSTLRRPILDDTINDTATRHTSSRKSMVKQSVRMKSSTRSLSPPLSQTKQTNETPSPIKTRISPTKSSYKTIPTSNHLDHPCTTDVLSVYSHTRIRFKRYSSPFLFLNNQAVGSVIATSLNVVLSSNNSTLHQHQEQSLQRNTRNVIRYGDVISLYNEESRALGVRKRKNDDNGGGNIVDISFFRKLLGNAEKWEVLPGNEDVVVGTDSHVHTQLLTETDNVLKISSKLGYPVKVGDPITLRNLYNYGVLAYNTSTKSLTTYTSIVSMNTQNHHNPLPHPSTEDFYTITPDEHCMWTMIQDDIPILSDLDYRGRMYSNGRFLLDASRFERYETQRGCYGLKYEEEGIPKERELLLELLGALMGLEGQYIRIQRIPDIDNDSSLVDDNDLIAPSLDMVEYVLNPSLSIPTCLSNRIISILPICTNYIRIRTYVSTRLSIYDYGKIHQALAAAMDELLQEYLTLICQLEQWYLSSKLSLQRLYVMLQSCFSTLQVMYNVVQCTNEYKGGQVLNSIQILYQSQYKGDETSQSTIIFLLQKASTPYLHMLKLWLYYGVLNDPYYEFMIVPYDKNNSSTKNINSSLVVAVEESWDYWFRIQSHHSFHGSLVLTKQDESWMLNTGKYLNAIRQCQDSIQQQTTFQEDGTTSFQYPLQSIPFHQTLSSCYNHASSSLLRLLFDDYDFMGILYMFKKYFLLYQGDFFVQFLDLAEKELSKDVHRVSRGHTLTLLTSCVPTIPLFCGFATCNVVDHLDAIHQITTGTSGSSYNPTTPSRLAYSKPQEETTLTGLEAFMLDFNISFPLSLILPKNVIAQYQLLFRHIFYAKRVERHLLQIWLSQQLFKRYSRDLPLNPTFLLRQRMIHFLQNFIYYVQLEVMYPAWEDMLYALENVAVTVEDVVEVHTIFMNRLLKESLVLDRRLLESLIKVMNTCLGFSEQMKRFLDMMEISDYSIKEEKSIQKDLYSETYTRMISRFTQVFDKQLDHFMELLKSSANESSSFLENLGSRLDFNGYYRKQKKR